MIVVDIETTGLDATVNGLVSVGAVDLYNPTNQFYGECRVRDGAVINDFALTVNGFTKEEVVDPSKLAEEELYVQFMEWSATCDWQVMAGENVGRFDHKWLEVIANKHDLAWPFGYRTFDNHTLCLTRMLESDYTAPMKDNTSALNLDKQLEYAGLPVEPKPHNALTGAKYEAEAISRILYGRQLLDELKQFPVPEYLRR